MLVNTRFDFATLGGHVCGCYAPGANFNAVKAAGLLFQDDDLHGGTFVGASLKRCYFGRSNLNSANFSNAKLQTAQFTGASCRDAMFLGADMRLAYCVDAEFSGADLSGVDMTEANLTRIRFDENTKVTGTILRGVTMSDHFRGFAERSGAILGPESGLHVIASFDATAKILEKENKDGSLTAVLQKMPLLRQRLVENPKLVWEDELIKESAPELANLLTEAMIDGSKDIADQLD